ncbi:MAG: D-alanyl-D-alanine carboxypeptidase/D-alanyl-D-alanine-endopeptidase [Ignavibacteriaceae bacterium]|nr:D-alanyl-D-alanine carboxypeptidase/D-alanyl-D-alanine-endopeptidase [Ignavibacteriaceae bacterium]
MNKRILSLILLLLLGFTFILNASSREELISKIRNILSKVPAGTNTSIMIYNPLNQDTILVENHTKSMVPASVTKLFTTATALTTMGGNHFFNTKLLTDDLNINDGIINGNLYIKGYGNSLFADNDLNEMISVLVKLGIKEITGDIIGDDTYFDDIYVRDDWIPNENANVKLPPISALVLDRNQTIVQRKVRKRIRNYTVNVKNPPLFAANKLKEKLSIEDIIVKGTAKSGTATYETKLIAESKSSLRDIISIINKNSDNFFAEILFKSIGAEASGKQGNSFYSQQTILNFIESNGIYKYGTSVVDGSGISRFDQVTLGAVTGILEKMYFDLVHFDDFFNSLSIAGVDGTLRNRMKGTAAENNFRGKTGTLNGVTSISGYITTSGGDELIVGIMFEFSRGSWNFYRNIQDEIIILLAEWNE